MSRTGGVPHVSAAGNEMVTPDVVGVSHDVASYPEAYVGVTEHGDYALAIRQANGREAAGTEGVMNLAWGETNWWPGGWMLPGRPTRPILR